MKKNYEMSFKDKYNNLQIGYIEIQLEEKTKGLVFTASGSFKEKNTNGRMVDSMGGQCLDHIKEAIGDTDKTFNIIYDMWIKYHLNDMKADCEHQRADKEFQEQKNKKIICYKWLHLKPELQKEKDELTKKIKKELSENGKINLSQREKIIHNLKDCIYNHIGDYDEYIYQHKPEDVEYKDANWIDWNKHTDGLLLKKCPVCGYKYGSSWLYMPIEENDLIIIKDLLKSL